MYKGLQPVRQEAQDHNKQEVLRWLTAFVWQSVESDILLCLGGGFSTQRPHSTAQSYGHAQYFSVVCFDDEPLVYADATLGGEEVVPWLAARQKYSPHDVRDQTSLLITQTRETASKRIDYRVVDAKDVKRLPLTQACFEGIAKEIIAQKPGFDYEKGDNMYDCLSVAFTDLPQRFAEHIDSFDISAWDDYYIDHESDDYNYESASDSDSD